MRFFVAKTWVHSHLCNWRECATRVRFRRWQRAQKIPTSLKFPATDLEGLLEVISYQTKSGSTVRGRVLYSTEGGIALYGKTRQIAMSESRNVSQHRWDEANLVTIGNREYKPTGSPAVLTFYDPIQFWHDEAQYARMLESQDSALKKLGKDILIWAANHEQSTVVGFLGKPAALDDPHHQRRKIQRTTGYVNPQHNWGVKRSLYGPLVKRINSLTTDAGPVRIHETGGGVMRVDNETNGPFVRLIKDRGASYLHYRFEEKWLSIPMCEVEGIEVN